jgi:hypothetical protein
MNQITNTVLMIRPATFRRNEQTSINNYYQRDLKGFSPNDIQKKAIFEFDTLVKKIRDVGVEVIVINDTMTPDTPDAIFPNNWISFHQNGTVCLYPMFSENRRLERRNDSLESLESNGFIIENTIDYSSAETEHVFLEGTGSMVLDRTNRIAYAALSPRTNEDLFIEFCEDLEFTPIIFKANQNINNSRKPIYHTNVMMCVGTTFAIVCLDCIDDKKEKKQLVQALKNSDKEIITISEQQLNHFAGNMLQLKGTAAKSCIVMSKSAYNILSVQQKIQLKKHGTIVYSNVDTIEICGGGSVRCMIAEIFLPRTD